MVAGSQNSGSDSHSTSATEAITVAASPGHSPAATNNGVDGAVQHALRGRFHHPHRRPQPLPQQPRVGKHAVRVGRGALQGQALEADQVGEQQQDRTVAQPGWLLGPGGRRSYLGRPEHVRRVDRTNS
jgi:hypothetical protein